ncbi:MAG: PP2C family protein-serine/threonine phosphatase, partial [Acidimicrobiales bacterium]
MIGIVSKRAAAASAHVFDLARFSLSDLVAYSASMRRAVPSQVETMSGAAQALVGHLRSSFAGQASGQPAFVLVRLFLSEAYEELPDELRALATAQLGEEPAPSGLRCLTLLGSDGDLPAWRDRRASVAHQVFPVSSAAAVARAPMVAALLEGLRVPPGIVAPGAGAGSGEPGHEDFGVFHVPRAKCSSEVPDQDFVTAHRVASVVGFGGLLPGRQLFGVVAFSRVEISHQTAQRFAMVAISTRLALLDAARLPVFPGQAPRRVPSPTLAAARIASYERLLAIQEAASEEQAAQLEEAVARSRRRAAALGDSEAALRCQDARLREEAEVAGTLRDAARSLAADLEPERVVQAATDIVVRVTGASFGAFFYDLVGDPRESHLLHTLSGEGREAFAGLPDPRDTALLGPTFRGEAVVRSGDVTADPRYGHDAPYHGTPPGHPPVRSYLAVPVVSTRGQVQGAFLLAHPEAEVFDERAEHLAVGMAGLTSPALDNARLYALERDRALELQEALLPGDLPVVEGLEAAVRYLPGAAGVEVGGDWYEVLPLAEGRTALIIGDVMGHDLRAAALMGQLRAAVQAYVLLHLAPGEMLAHLDRLVSVLGRDQIATCIYAVHDAGTATLRLASAGHPPPALVSPDLPTAYLELPTGTPLGVGGGRYQEAMFPFPVGTTLVLYTDGLVETRRRPLGEGLRRLAERLDVLR